MSVGIFDPPEHPSPNQTPGGGGISFNVKPDIKKGDRIEITYKDGRYEDKVGIVKDVYKNDDGTWSYDLEMQPKK